MPYLDDPREAVHLPLRPNLDSTPILLESKAVFVALYWNHMVVSRSRTMGVIGYLVANVLTEPFVPI
jgi:hypothetical protein